MAKEEKLYELTYVKDSWRTKKVTVSGNVNNIGTTPINASVTVEGSSPEIIKINLYHMFINNIIQADIETLHESDKYNNLLKKLPIVRLRRHINDFQNRKLPFIKPINNDISIIVDDPDEDALNPGSFIESPYTFSVDEIINNKIFSATIINQKNEIPHYIEYHYKSLRSLLEVLLDFQTAGEIERFYNSFWYKNGFRPFSMYRRNKYKGLELLHATKKSKIGKWRMYNSDYSFKNLGIFQKFYGKTSWLKDINKYYWSHLKCWNKALLITLSIGMLLFIVANLYYYIPWKVLYITLIKTPIQSLFWFL